MKILITCPFCKGTGQLERYALSEEEKAARAEAKAERAKRRDEEAAFYVRRDKQIWDMHEGGMSFLAIGRELGVSGVTTSRCYWRQWRRKRRADQ